MELNIGSVDGNITSPESSDTEPRAGFLVYLSSIPPEAADESVLSTFPKILQKEFQQQHQILYFHHNVAAHRHL